MALINEKCGLNESKLKSTLFLYTIHTFSSKVGACKHGLKTAKTALEFDIR